jgi:hypothetical protein
MKVIIDARAPSFFEDVPGLQPERAMPLKLGENELPDSTEEFLKVVQPYGRFKASLGEDGVWVLEFHNDYD